MMEQAAKQSPAMSGPEKLRALVEEMRAGLEGVTPGPWQVYDGCSWRRIGTLPGRGNYDCAVIAPTVASDGHPDLTCSAGNDREANLAHIARCSPENIAALLDAAESSLASPAGMEGDGPAEIEIDRLRLAAFKSNSDEDIAAYYSAASKWFQDRHYRAMLSAAPRGEAE